MKPIPLVNDPLLDIIGYLETRLSYKIAEDLTGWHKPETRVTLQPTGGRVINPIRVFRPIYDVNVYASSKPLAHATALEVLQELYLLEGMVLPSGQVITEVDCSMPSDISDPINSNPRFVFDATITLRTA